MIKFKTSSFIVEVETGGNPIENWLATHQELCDALQCEDESMLAKRYHYLELLKQLMPDWETARQLMPDINQVSKFKN